MTRFRTGMLTTLAVMITACGGGHDTPPAAPDQRVAGASTGAACRGEAGLICADEGDYCHVEEADWGRLDATGQCRERPQMCTREYRPVCAADGTTHPNACVARSSGADIIADGPCAPEAN